MKICFVIQDCTTIGGTERATCCLATELARRGHEVCIVSAYGINGKCAFEKDEKVGFEILSDTRYGLEMNTFRRMAEVLRTAGRIKRCKSIAEADVLICQKFFAAAVGVMAGFGGRMVVGEHFPYQMYGKSLRAIRNMIYRKARKMVVLTESCAEEYRKAGIMTTVIPNMVSFEGGEHHEEGKVIVAAGRLSHEKGFDMLVEAFAREKENLDGWKVEIYGEGECKKELEDKIREKQLEGRIIMAGHAKDMAKVFEHGSFGVVPSRFESFSLVAIEALSCGMPIVAFDCPTGPREILKQGGGMLVKNGDIAELGKAMTRMANDKELRTKIGQECKSITYRYSADRVVSQWEELIGK